ncbi:MAG: hypothetical protein A2Z46_06925 [Nitrospirae bacterium RBG_19FT_COMBO_55_12]|nr:MAG: hypothetical protein A2Z46_06925 [Nitrospirae bacterium RBG_19FT_COMBO_55_12]
MPPLEKHIKTSMEKTGKDFKAVHEWIDSDPVKKAERHDITKIYEYGKMIEEQYGKDAREEYIRHIHDDVKAKFEHIRHDLEKSIAETLAYFGVK